MKDKLVIKASFVADKLLNGSLCAFSSWLEENGIDPFKRPLVYEVDHDKQLIHIKQ